MQRVIPAEQINDSPDARYHRTMRDAFPFAPHDLVCEQDKKSGGIVSWLAFIAVALALVSFGVHTVTQRSAELPRQTTKERAAQSMCGKGKHAEWVDDKTVQCLREL